MSRSSPLETRPCSFSNSMMDDTARLWRLGEQVALCSLGLMLGPGHLHEEPEYSGATRLEKVWPCVGWMGTPSALEVIPALLQTQRRIPCPDHSSLIGESSWPSSLSSGPQMSTF